MNEFTKFLTAKEVLKLIRFEDKHKKCIPGAIGGGVSYTLTPTGLGTLCSVKCNVCGKELALNDLSNA